MTSSPRLSRFSACNIEKLGVAWVRGYYFSASNFMPCSVIIVILPGQPAVARVWCNCRAYHSRVCTPSNFLMSFMRCGLQNDLTSRRASNNCSNSFERRVFRQGISVQLSNGYFESIAASYFSENSLASLS